MKKFKVLLWLFLWVSGITGVMVLLSFSERQLDARPCTKVDIDIRYDGENHFIEPEDIKEMLKEKNPSLEGTPMCMIKTHELEKMLDSHTHISNAEVSKSNDGVVTVEVEPKRPIARIINNSGESFYLDTEGSLMRWSPNFTARVPVFTGKIFESYDHCYKLNYRLSDINDSLLIKNNLYTLYQFAVFLDSSDFWKAQIEQVYIGEEVELVPTAGSHIVVMGNFVNFREKLNRLMIFYKEAMPKVGWDTYKIINLKYRGQVVCTRADGGIKSKKKIKTESKSTT